MKHEALSMPVRIVAGLGVMFLVAVILQLTASRAPSPPAAEKRDPPKEGAFPDFKITSPAFAPDGDIPAKYTCDGANVSPRLEIQGVPPETKSLALLMTYLDQGSGNISVHWLMWNIDPKTTVLAEGAAPPGAVQGMNDFQRAKYLGPCLDKGNPRSHFVFSLYALDRLANVAAGTAAAAFIHQALDGHTIATALLSGYYGR